MENVEYLNFDRLQTQWLIEFLKWKGIDCHSIYEFDCINPKFKVTIDTGDDDNERD